MTIFAQGDLLIERVADAKPGMPLPADPDGAVVLARGEVTGHRHAIYGDGAVLFRDEGLARDIPAELYVGHLRIAAPTALVHEEHDAIPLEPGTYRVRRQREWTTESTRVGVGHERALKLLKARKVYRDRYGTLYREPGYGRDPYTVVEVENGTPEPDGTRKRYYLAVPSTCQTALEAVAWTYGMTPEQYSRIERRT